MCNAVACRHRVSLDVASPSILGKDFIPQLLERKKWEVRELESQYADPLDPVQLRLSYVAEKSSLKLTRALRLFALGDENRRVSVVGDLKRLSPTALNMPRTVGSFVDAGRRADELFDWGVNVLMVNTDETGWGGNKNDLDSVAAAVKARVERRKTASENPELAPNVKTGVYASGPMHTAILCKDIIIHPLQIAEAVERGADGVLLIASVCGGRLPDLMDACTIMGTECVVECHTPNECAYAIEQGAMSLMLNCWDRSDGAWHADQAEAVRRMVPDHVVTIAAGGMGSSDQARRLSDCGFDGVCLGRALVLHPDPPQLVRNIRDFQASPLLAGVNGNAI